MILMAAHVWYLLTFHPGSADPFTMDGPYPQAECQRLADTSVMKFCKSMLPDKTARSPE